MELGDRIAGLMKQAEAELGELVAIRSVADPRQFPPEECAAAAQWIVDKFAELGFVLDSHFFAPAVHWQPRVSSAAQIASPSCDEQGST